jgi:hypothetical protein
MAPSTEGNAALLEAMMNLTRFHREHEKFYASSPREFAVILQRHARTLQALADQWSTAEPSTRTVLSPYEGAEDLNSPLPCSSTECSSSKARVARPRSAI